MRLGLALPGLARRAPAAADYWLATTAREILMQQQQQGGAPTGEEVLLQLLEGLQGFLQPLTDLVSSSSSRPFWSDLQQLGQSLVLLLDVLATLQQQQQQLPADQLAELRLGLRPVYQQQLPRLAGHPGKVQYCCRLSGAYHG
jgi:inactivated superfamily I helicase